MCFWKRLNDYSCISKNDPDADEIYHYTNSADAVKGIITGCFWATDIRDFSANGEDVNEGYLILRQLRERISQLDGAGNVEIVNKLIGTEDAMHDYFNNHETYLISMSTNGDSEYMWQNRAGDNGYEIVLDKKKFIDSLYFKVKNGNIRRGDNYIKHTKILYDQSEQEKILKREYRELIAQECPSYFSNKEYIRCILDHMIYVGNFYKLDTPKYKKEEEYRILINTVAHKDPETDAGLPERHFNCIKKKWYAEINFCPQAIKKIVCATESAKKILEGNVPCSLKIEVRDLNRSSALLF